VRDAKLGKRRCATPGKPLLSSRTYPPGQPAGFLQVTSSTPSRRTRKPQNVGIARALRKRERVIRVQQLVQHDRLLRGQAHVDLDPVAAGEVVARTGPHDDALRAEEREHVGARAAVRDDVELGYDLDTLYVDVQHRFAVNQANDRLSRVEQVKKPDVDFVYGLSPVVSIEQKTIGRNPRSTVGTMTDIGSYLNLLFATIAQPHCPRTG